MQAARAPSSIGYEYSEPPCMLALGGIAISVRGKCRLCVRENGFWNQGSKWHEWFEFVEARAMLPYAPGHFFILRRRIKTAGRPGSSTDTLLAQ